MRRRENKQNGHKIKTNTLPWKRTKQHNALEKNKTTQCTGEEQNNTMHWRRKKQHNALEKHKPQGTENTHKTPCTGKT